jgi:hypothetical protein
MIVRYETFKTANPNALALDTADTFGFTLLLLRTDTPTDRRE